MKILLSTLLVLLLGLGSTKVFYMGSQPIDLGKVDDFQVLACETKHSFGSFVSRDARGGFYRIYDDENQKVFELFSDTFAYDIVITSADQAEFQLASGEIYFWKKPQ